MAIVVNYCLIILGSFVLSVNAFAEQGRWTFDMNSEKNVSGVIKAVYEETGLYIKVLCSAPEKDVNVSISFTVRKMRCYQEALNFDDLNFLEKLHDNPSRYVLSDDEYADIVEFMKSEEHVHLCDNSIIVAIDESQSLETRLLPTAATKVVSENQQSSGASTSAAAVVNLMEFTTASILNTQSPINSSTSPEETRKRREAKDETKNEKAQPPAPSKVSVLTTTHPPDKVPLDDMPQYVIPVEGIFIITIKVASTKNFSASVELEIKGKHGHLSAVDWPLLPFYCTMCVIYFIYGVAWLLVLALQWRDLLRIQFWIGGVIFLGMIEKATFYAEYQSVNSTGNSVQGAVLFAELVWCLKRTLARMLVVIVSLGFGIVKPRLGPMLHRVVGVGGLYFLLCSLEAFLRVMRPKHDPAKTLMLAEVPLAILDTAICWWIFSNLVQTTRTLRLRRNIVKLSLYRHFTNTLIFACIASAAFMVWAYKAHKLPKCVTDWKELWVDDAYWHLLFSVILLVIMILWRPTNNNQRYAFTPLIDAADDEEEDNFINDAFDGMKSRNLKTMNAMGTLKEKEPLRKKGDEDLAWVEENIPSSLADSALPSLLDSDEEIMNTKFEMSKME